MFLSVCPFRQRNFCLSGAVGGQHILTLAGHCAVATLRPSNLGIGTPDIQTGRGGGLAEASGSPLCTGSPEGTALARWPTPCCPGWAQGLCSCGSLREVGWKPSWSLHDGTTPPSLLRSPLPPPRLPGLTPRGPDSEPGSGPRQSSFPSPPGWAVRQGAEGGSPRRLLRPWSLHDSLWSKPSRQPEW